MKRNKIVKNFMCGGLLLSLTLNVIFLLPYNRDIFTKICERFFPVEYWTEKSSDRDVIISITNYAFKSNCEGKIIMDEHHGLIEDVKKFFRGKERQSHIKNNFFSSYYYAGLSYYALYYKNSEMTSFLIDIADNIIDKNTMNINYDIYVVDQYSIGIFFINLYKLTGDILYRQISNGLYEDLLKRRDSEDLIVYLENSPLHYEDELGMYVPFLMEYFEMSNDSTALNIVNKNISTYMEYGIDRDTHLPYHGYCKESKIKLGSANWGRGIGWYLLALAYCPQFNDKLLDDNIENLPYTQFPLTSSNFDSSTALMFEIYKQSKSPQRKVDLSFIKPHIRKDGIVDHFSGDTYAFNDYSHMFGCSELGNGFLLMLITKFNNGTRTTYK